MSSTNISNNITTFTCSPEYNAIVLDDGFLDTVNDDPAFWYISSRESKSHIRIKALFHFLYTHNLLNNFAEHTSKWKKAISLCDSSDEIKAFDELVIRLSKDVKKWAVADFKDFYNNGDSDKHTYDYLCPLVQDKYTFETRGHMLVEAAGYSCVLLRNIRDMADTIVDTYEDFDRSGRIEEFRSFLDITMCQYRQTFALFGGFTVTVLEYDCDALIREGLLFAVGILFTRHGECSVVGTDMYKHILTELTRTKPEIVQSHDKQELPSGTCECSDTTKTAKYDGGKLRYDLICPEIDRALAEVYTAGCKKYSARNCENAGDDFAWGRWLGAAKRHLSEWEMCNEIDEETGCRHLAQAMWNLGMLLTYQERGIGVDDRSPYHKNKRCEES